MRTATVERKTRETEISVSLDLDGTGDAAIDTGIGFLDHMLESFSRHSMIDLKVRATGDLHVDYHHTTEDTAIVIGQAVKQALGDFSGITRFGSALIPMDEALTRVAIDISNRPYLIWHVKIPKPKLGEMDTELFKENGSRLSPRMPACACISKICMPTTAITLSRPALRVWRGHCGKPLRRMSALMAPRLPARAVSRRSFFDCSYTLAGRLDGASPSSKGSL